MMNKTDFLTKYGLTVSPDTVALNSTKTVVVGMSGGVDSSVTAALLHFLGYKVKGVFMKNWNKCQSDDYEDVVRVCLRLGITDFHHLNLSDDYYDLVFDAFLRDLKMGLTPSPDILCNKHIKFDVFLKACLNLGADYLATGHYANLVDNKLTRPLDLTKDQTYFLHDVNPIVWSKVLFPLGNLTKKTVRLMARDLNLPVMDKKDSMGICFIGNKNFTGFIKNYLNSPKGNIILPDNSILGTHSGLFNYTVGQSKGLGLKFHKKVMVIGKNLRTNSLIVDLWDSPRCWTHIVNCTNLTASGDCFVRFSNLGTLHPCRVNNGLISLDKAVRLVAPGQAAVFYNSTGVVLGGGNVLST